MESKDTVDHATHAGDPSPEDVVECGGQSKQDATDCCEVVRVLID